jgi:hypothetical protein
VQANIGLHILALKSLSALFNIQFGHFLKIEKKHKKTGEWFCPD